MLVIELRVILSLFSAKIVARNYPFSEPDGPHNVHFEEHKKIESAAPLIKGGTLVKLIERLTHPQSVDLQYLTQFLLTYRMFCQPQELLRLLLQRYEVPPPKGVIEKPQLVRRFAKRYYLCLNYSPLRPPPSIVISIFPLFL